MKDSSLQVLTPSLRGEDPDHIWGMGGSGECIAPAWVPNQGGSSESSGSPLTSQIPGSGPRTALSDSLRVGPRALCSYRAPRDPRHRQGTFFPSAGLRASQQSSFALAMTVQHSCGFLPAQYLCPCLLIIRLNSFFRKLPTPSPLLSPCSLIEADFTLSFPLAKTQIS